MPLLNEKIINEIVISASELADSDGKRKKSSFEYTSIPIPIDENSVPKKSLFERIPAFGLICAILSVVCFSLASLIVKLITSLHSIEILVIRSVFQLIFYGSSIAINRYSILGNKENRLNLAMRAVSGTISLSSIYMAYRLMPLSDASTIHFSSPVFVTVFAYFMLSEPFTKLQVITGAFTLVGVTIISKPEFLFGSTESVAVHDHRLVGTILAVIAAITAALSIINLRKLKSTPAAVVVFWFSVSLIVSGLIILYILNQLVMPSGLWTWALLVGIGFCGIGDQYFLTLALQYESAGPVSVTRTFNIVLSFIWEALILSEAIEWTSVVGACLVSSCVIILAVVKWRTENPKSFAKLELLFRRCCCCHNGQILFIESLPQSMGVSTNSIDTAVVDNTIHSRIDLIDERNNR